MEHRAFKFKLYPTDEQETQFRQFAGVTRLVYNLALVQRSEHWEAFKRCTGKSISFPSQSRELTNLRREFCFVRDCPQVCQQQALRDLDATFQKFFKKQCGYPKPRNRDRHSSFRFQGRECQFVRLSDKWGKVRLPKVGWVKFRMSRDIEGRLLNCTVSLNPLGWHIAFACEVELLTQPAPNTAIGIDRGVTVAIATSEGALIRSPVEALNILDRRKRKQQRKLARCKRGSSRRNKLKQLIAKNSAKQARIRQHFNHVQSKRIAERHSVVVLENLKTASMTRSAKGTLGKPGSNVRQKSALNYAILYVGWHQFESFLSYKLTERGGKLIKVNPAYTSQMCSCCASISKQHRENQALFNCKDCGHVSNADINAAINILKAGTPPTDSKVVLAA